MTDFTAGTLFVRISLDQIATMDELQALATTGALVRPGALHVG
jgi:hypothetical protein